MSFASTKRAFPRGGCNAGFFASCGILAASFCGAGPAFAHHPGGIGNTGGAGPINTISASTIPAGMSVGYVVYDRIELDPLSDAQLLAAGNAAIADGEEHAHIHSLKSLSATSLNFAYGLTDDVQIAVRLPYVKRTDINEVHADAGPPPDLELEQLGDSAGIGDLSVIGQWRLVKDPSGFEAAVLLGLKTPTGKTDEVNDEDELFDAEFQPGSGSWDGLFGLALTQRVGSWSFDGSVLYSLVGDGTQDTNLGDRLAYGLAVSYRVPLAGGSASGHADHEHEHKHEGHVHSHSDEDGPTLDLVLELNGEWSDKQTEGGETDPNSGGSTLFIAPGVRYAYEKWSAFASVGIPVVNDLNGVQAEPDWRVVTGLSLAF
jgi:hypothetical protein